MKFVYFILLGLVFSGCETPCDPDTDDFCEEFDPTPLVKQDVVCNDQVCPMNLCLVDTICVNGLWCSGSAQIEGIDDGNACTVDICNPLLGVPVHIALEQADVDDGNACTRDICDPFSGPVHVDICN